MILLIITLSIYRILVENWFVQNCRDILKSPISRDKNREKRNARLVRTEVNHIT